MAPFGSSSGRSPRKLRFKTALLRQIRWISSSGRGYDMQYKHRRSGELIERKLEGPAGS